MLLAAAAAGGRISQDRRRGTAAEDEEEEAGGSVPPEHDLVRRSSGKGRDCSPAEEDSMPARRSRRQEAQKPVTGLVG